LWREVSRTICAACKKAPQGGKDHLGDRRGARKYTGNFWGDVERSKKVPSLDTIVAMAKGLGVSPSTLLLLEREEDPRDLRKHIDSLLDNTSPQQLELLHRIIKTIVEP